MLIETFWLNKLFIFAILFFDFVSSHSTGRDSVNSFFLQLFCCCCFLLLSLAAYEIGRSEKTENQVARMEQNTTTRHFFNMRASNETWNSRSLSCRLAEETDPSWTRHSIIFCSHVDETKMYKKIIQRARLCIHLFFFSTLNGWCRVCPSPSLSTDRRHFSSDIIECCATLSQTNEFMFVRLLVQRRILHLKFSMD